MSFSPDDIIVSSSAHIRPMNDAPDVIEQKFPDKIGFSELAAIVNNFITQGYTVEVEHNPNVIRATRAPLEGPPAKKQRVKKSAKVAAVEEAKVAEDKSTDTPTPTNPKPSPKSSKKRKEKAVTNETPVEAIIPVIPAVMATAVEPAEMKVKAKRSKVTPKPKVVSAALPSIPEDSVFESEPYEWSTVSFIIRAALETEHKRHQETIVDILSKLEHSSTPERNPFDDLYI